MPLVKHGSVDDALCPLSNMAQSTTKRRASGAARWPSYLEHPVKMLDVATLRAKVQRLRSDRAQDDTPTANGW